MQRGSDGNVDVGAKQISSGRSMIKIFNRAEIAQRSIDYSSTSSGKLLAWGLRNAVAVGEHPFTGEIVSPAKHSILCISIGCKTNYN